jgi:hypothetical protein
MGGSAYGTLTAPGRVSLQRAGERAGLYAGQRTVERRAG